MFFYPTIKNIKESNNIHFICLSNGNYEGQGNIREKELNNLLLKLNLNKLLILNFEDNINKFWNIEKIEKIIKEYINQNNIDILITFDKKGISYHPNHISCFLGIQNIKNVDIFSLETVPFYRKYISFFDIFNIKKKDTIFLNYNIIELFYFMSIHWSQLTWYRLLFILLSRYSFINILIKINTK